MQTVTLAVDDEVKALGDAIGVLIADIKAGKTIMQDFTDTFALLIGAVGSMQSLPVDIKKVDNQAYLGMVFAKQFEPAV